MAKEKYKVAQVIKALRKNKGMIHKAAKSLGCSHVTIYNYARKHPTVQDTIDDERGIFLDDTELALADAVERGEGWAVCFTLKTLGKSRGYVERQEITGDAGGPIKVIGVAQNDLDWDNDDTD